MKPRLSSVPLILCLAPWIAIGIAIGLAPYPALGAVHPHYEALLQKGLEAHRAGRQIEATDTLRLACFGMLTEPSALAPCLVHLAIAQSAAGDDAGFRATWKRLAEVEGRFRVYEACDLPSEVRAMFARILARSVAPGDLEPGSVFAVEANDAAMDDLDTLSPRKRRRELLRRAAESPQDPRWGFLLASMDAAEGKRRRARDRLEALLASHPEHSDSRCLAARLSTAAGADAAAAQHYALCAAARTDPVVAGDHLQTLAQLERWDEAVTAYLALDPTARGAVGSTELGTLLESLAVGDPPRAAGGAERSPGTDAGVRAEPPPARRSTGTQPRPPKPRPSEPRPSEPQPEKLRPEKLQPEKLQPEESQAAAPQLAEKPQEPAEIERIRAEALRATDLGDLDRVLSEALGLADARPTDPEAQLLAAELLYRASNWAESARYFDRAGEVSRSRPLLLFYQAVALYETGRGEEAETALHKCLSRLSRTPYVQGYIDRILPVERNP